MVQATQHCNIVEFVWVEGTGHIVGMRWFSGLTMHFLVPETLPLTWHSFPISWGQPEFEPGWAARCLQEARESQNLPCLCQDLTPDSDQPGSGFQMFLILSVQGPWVLGGSRTSSSASAPEAVYQGQDHITRCDTRRVEELGSALLGKALFFWLCAAAMPLVILAPLFCDCDHPRAKKLSSSFAQASSLVGAAGSYSCLFQIPGHAALCGSSLCVL